MKLLIITLTVLQSLFTTLEKHTLQSDFNINITAEDAQPMTYTGSLSMRGKQFELQMFSMDAAYDGHTLYIYSEDTDELSLSIPTEEELLTTNPFLYAQALFPACDYAECVMGDKTQITLTPKANATNLPTPIVKFVLRVNTATLLPISVEIQEQNGTITTLRLINAHFTATTPSFVLTREGAFINDLR